MTAPLTVSVVVPAWNAREWIEETLSTVAAQASPEMSLDVVVVDDGSTDGTSEVARAALRRFGLAHTMVRHEQSLGPSAARNAGWQIARGEWVQFLDADDLLEPEKVGTQLRALADAAGDVAIVFSPWGRLWPDGRSWRRDAAVCGAVIGPEVLVDLIGPGNFIAIHSYLVRRSWLERVGGFDESLRLIEDVDLQLRIAAAGGGFRCVSDGTPLAWYRQRPGSSSRSDERGFVEACVRNARWVEDTLRGRGGLSPRAIDVISGVYFRAARFFFSIDRPQFDRLVEAIYRVSPQFMPPGPPALRRLSRLVGYPRAESFATRYRQWLKPVEP